VAIDTPSESAICFDNVSKRYVIERVTQLTPRRFRKARKATVREDVWALKDVSFAVRRGEVFGIMGPNGSGKSTLLKILSSVVKPTSGRVGVNGRITSLLEVGTGFHPELTGRENVYLNGAILGLSTEQVRQRFDRIVAFAEVERYIDTPVKRYSSGMYVRLAFSIAAHLDFEVMVVDEVLAVGDARFRERCLDLIEVMARDEGRTVIFVSHDLSQIRRLAGRAMLLDAGKIVRIGKPNRVISRYLRGEDLPTELADDASKTQRLTIKDHDGKHVESLVCGAACTFVMDIGLVPEDAQAEVSLYDLEGTCMSSLYTGLATGKDLLVCAIDAMTLRQGDYRAEVALYVHGTKQLERYDLGMFEVTDVEPDSDFQSGRGLVALKTHWGRAATVDGPPT
jgi:lipopolysaccharide transport system ATP-binding protein